jgi:hypothetical protein
MAKQDFYFMPNQFFPYPLDITQYIQGVMVNVLYESSIWL